MNPITTATPGSNAFDLAALLQNLSLASDTLPPLDDIVTTEMIIVIADSQAQWLEKAAASVRRLAPTGAHASPAKAVFASQLLASLAHYTQQANHIAASHRARLKALRATLAMQEKRAVHDVLHAFDHFTWPLAQLLQELPGDITNQSTITPEQAHMCESVAALSNVEQDTVLDGLEALGALLAMAGDTVTPEMVSHCGRLLGWLTAQSRLMGHNAAEYGAAAQNLRRN